MAPPMIKGFDDKASILDPRSDVIVDACAGSGKTWLLTSRIIRALLLGAKVFSHSIRCEYQHISWLVFSNYSVCSVVGSIGSW